MADEKQQNNNCLFHIGSMKQMADDIKELNNKVSDIPILIVKFEQFIDAYKKMQEDLELVSEMHTKILLLEQSRNAMEKENRDLKRSFAEFKKEDFKSIKEAVTMAKGMAFLIPGIWALLMFVFKFV